MTNYELRQASSTLRAPRNLIRNARALKRLGASGYRAVVKEALEAREKANYLRVNYPELVKAAKVWELELVKLHAAKNAFYTK